MVKMAKKEGLYVKSIKNGTVIDHIQSGMALNVLRILRVDGREGNVLSVVMNVPSKKMKTKDIVKIENRELKPAEVDKIALISPRATINIINEWNVVKKNNVKFQEVIRGIIKCNNSSCISNANEPVEPTFTVEHKEPTRIKCHYCNRIMEMEDIISQF